jgi:hypothetical protein
MNERLEALGFKPKHVQGLYNLVHFERNDGAWIQCGRSYAAKNGKGDLTVTLRSLDEAIVFATS